MTAMMSNRLILLSAWQESVQVTDGQTYHGEDRVYILHSMSIVSQIGKGDQEATYKKKPELAAPAPTSTQRRIPTGMRHSRLIGMKTLMP